MLLAKVVVTKDSVLDVVRMTLIRKLLIFELEMLRKTLETEAEYEAFILILFWLPTNVVTIL